MQRAQQEFDEAAGLAFPAPEGDASAALHRLEFACLALAGEVGELANLIKKRRRAMWTGATAPDDEAAVREELADVLAYTLKLANVLDIDLDAAYREKMGSNRRRFQPPRVLSLMGPPGGGKTTVAERLAHRLQVYVERYTLNPNLHFYEWESQEQARLSQMWFLDSVDDFLHAADPRRPLVLDQEPRAVVDVYGQALQADGWLDDAAMAELQVRLAQVEARLDDWPGPRGAILLDADAQVLDDRVRARDGRSAGVDAIGRLQLKFGTLAERMGDVEVIRTDRCSVDDVVARVRERFLASA